MKILSFRSGVVIALTMLFIVACKKTMPPNNNGNGTIAKQKCDVQHACPLGYTCDGGYCKKKPVGCNCSVRPIPPYCGIICGE